MTGPAHGGHSYRRVSASRWREAQDWELDFWRKRIQRKGWRAAVTPFLVPPLRALNWSRAWGDDWNEWWKARFDSYSFLPRDLGDVVEFGCGPYTNVRLILQGRQARRVVCSDPLVKHYVDFPGRWLSREVARGRVEVDDHPLEETPFEPESFDTVVLVNVLDHVQDADLCLANAVAMVRPGGFLVFGQDLSSDDDLRRHPHDVGHPIRLRREELEPHLESLRAVHRVDLPRGEGRDPRIHYGTLVYAGRKDSPQES